MRYELRAVLAAAYTGRQRRLEGNLHTHTVEVHDDGRIVLLCHRVKLENLADAGSLSQTEREGIPSCPYCQSKLRALARRAVNGS